eukprot:m.73027 g.73027  ORF g.73027 m.73027 type:complete len:147 (-) comp11766_c0_seq1:193-633(-)
MEHRISVTEKEIGDFRIAFYDDDRGDGILTVELLESWCRNIELDVKKSKLKSLCTQFNNKSIDFKRLLELLAQEVKVDTSDELLKVSFEAFDEDKSGQLSHDEIRSMLTGLENRPTDREIEEMIRMMDQDGDGQIDYDEFVSFMRQ